MSTESSVLTPPISTFDTQCKIVSSGFEQTLGNLPTDSVDLILTDPPYNISRKTGFQSIGENSVERFAVSMEFGRWDETSIDLDTFSACAFRVLRKGGTAIVFYDVWKFNYLANSMSSAGFKQLRIVHWEKTNPVPLNSKRNYLTNSREVAVLGVKGGSPTFNGEYDNGVYKYPIPREKRVHPTQKPLNLFADLIDKHSNSGDLVVDPFIGSGTTAVAALRAGRRFAGGDIDEEYVRLAHMRVAKETERLL